MSREALIYLINFFLFPAVIATLFWGFLDFLHLRPEQEGLKHIHFIPFLLPAARALVIVMIRPLPSVGGLVF